MDATRRRVEDNSSPILSEVLASGLWLPFLDAVPPPQVLHPDAEL